MVAPTLCSSLLTLACSHRTHLKEGVNEISDLPLEMLIHGKINKI